MCVDIRRGGRHICGEDVALDYLRGGGKETWNKIISHTYCKNKLLLTYFLRTLEIKEKKSSFFIQLIKINSIEIKDIN